MGHVSHSLLLRRIQPVRSFVQVGSQALVGAVVGAGDGEGGGPEPPLAKVAVMLDPDENEAQAPWR